MRININILIIMFLFKYLAAQTPTVINVEIDWMEIPGHHSHRPNQIEINAVVDMFACHGINLNVIVSNSVPHINVLQRDPNNLNNFFNYTGPNSYGAIKAVNFDNPGGGWHYCIFAHQYQDENGNTTTSSGIANFNGDFVVSLGAFSGQIGTDWDRAATFAHELGHNLGLIHSGGQDIDLIGPYSPVIPSVMTYFYQLTGVRNNLECQGLVPKGLTLFKNLDYSNGNTCSLNESALLETFGLGIKIVDWNCSGSIETDTTYQRDLSNDRTTYGWCSSNGNISGLMDYDEWSNIRDLTFRIADSKTQESASSKTISCITVEENMIYKHSMAFCDQPPAVTEACVNNRMIYASWQAPGFYTGSCSRPYPSLRIAYNLAMSGDIVYLAPGNYYEPNLVLDKPLIISGPGHIVIGEQ